MTKKAVEARRLVALAPAAVQLSVSVGFLRRKVHEGKVAAVRMGDRILIPAAEVERVAREGLE